MKRILMIVLMTLLVSCTVRESKEELINFMTLYDLSGDEDIYSVSMIPLKDLRDSGKSGGPSDMIQLSSEDFADIYHSILEIKCSKKSPQNEVSLENLPDYFIHFAFVKGEGIRSYELQLGENYITLTDIKNSPEIRAKHSITEDEYKAVISAIEDLK